MDVTLKGGRGNKAPYETKMMRVPVPIAEKVQQALDEYRYVLTRGGEPPELAQSPDATVNAKHVDELIKAVDKFVEMKQSQWGANPKQKGEFSIASRSWDMFRQFKQMLEESPDKLLDDCDSEPHQ